MARSVRARLGIATFVAAALIVALAAAAVSLRGDPGPGAASGPGATSTANRRTADVPAATVPPATPSATAQPTGVTGSTPTPRRIIGILSDSHAYGADSWWRQTVVTGTVPGLRSGPFESHPGARTSDLTSRLDAAVAGADLVVVQAGTNDLHHGTSPEETARGIGALWDGITERGASPVAALVPPSERLPAQAADLNRRIAAEAAARGLPLIDVYTAVAEPDGSWSAGFTDDGVHSSRKGSDLLAASARSQLSALAR